MVVKLLRKDEISTSWRKTIGEESGRNAGRDRGVVRLRRSEKRTEELRRGGFDNCNPLPCRGKQAVLVDE